MFILPRTSTRSLLTRRILPTSSTATATATAPIHTSPISQSTTKDSAPANTLHTTDTYSKDIDTTPVEDTSVHRVDPSSDLVQKPHEPPSGPWSRAGVQTEEYRSVQGAKGGQGGAPYEPKGSSGTRYGSRMSWADDKGRETSGPEEGPAEGSSKGRK